MSATHPTRRLRQSDGASPYLLWIIWILWLFFLAQPLSALLSLPPSSPKVIGLGGLMLFVGLYLWITWQEAWRLTRATPVQKAFIWREWAPISLLLLLAIALTLIEGQSALGSLIYVSAALCGRVSGWRAVTSVVGLTLLAVLLGALIRAPLSATAQIFFIVPAVGTFVYFFGRAVRTNQELRRARQEIARLAVSEERLRFARDLHDLLGHTLSLIALKSELARRLVSASPEQAISEIGDIESAARQALVEVREAVAAYRKPSLQAELDAAQELLAAAGVAFTREGAPPPLSAATEAALAWATRESVTNVIRHSQARSCVIALTQEDDRVALEVRDDGATRPSAEIAAQGSGLAGLRERVTALGGSCAAGPAEGGGWRLMVSLPVGAAPATAEASVASGQEKAREQAREKRVTAWFG